LQLTRDFYTHKVCRTSFARHFLRYSSAQRIHFVEAPFGDSPMHQLRGSRVRFAVLLLTFFVLHASLSTKASAQGNFLPAVHYGVGTNPSFIIASDFNGDGKLDFAVANQNNNNVSVLLGNAGGTYQPAMNYSVGSVPISIAVGDFNRDGKPDLAVANDNSASVSVLLGNGDGTFQSAVNYPAGSTPASVVVGDFNADGKLDLAVASTGPNSVTVLLGNGNGTFQAPVSYAAGGLAFFVAVGDFNVDGKLDLATANFSDNNVSVLLGNGNGTFQAPVIYAVGTTPIFIAIGDLNGDGKPDMVVANANTSNVGTFGNISVLLGNGDGSFQAAASYPADVGPQSVAIGDFNGDGKFDLAVSNASSFNVTLLYGNGDGTFQTGVNYATGGNPKGIAVGDFNGDGRPDLAVTNFVGNSVGVLLNNVLPTTPTTNGLSFVGPMNYSAGVSPASVSNGDFNGDGKLDLVVPNSVANNVSVLLGNGDGSFLPGVNYTTGADPSYVAVADINSDGKLDLVVVNSSGGSVSVLLGNGNGTFQHVVNYFFGLSPVSAAVGDFNTDGKLDLVVVSDISNNNNLSVLLGNGDGTFQPATNYATGAGPAYSVVVEDFNADGKLDLAITNYNNNSMSVMLGNGNGTFQGAVNYPLGTQPNFMTAADFNGDGRYDLAIANAISGTVSILLGNGDGTFQTPVNFSAGTNTISVAARDLNGDGKLDLVVANNSNNFFNTSPNTVSVLLGNGGGSFNPPVPFVAGVSSRFVIVGDFNSDGKPDLAVANSNGNDASVLLNAGGTSATAMSSAAPAFFGQSVDLTATLAKTLGTNTPSGTIQFQKGATNFGAAVSLSGSNGISTAVLSTSTLSVGTHIFTALYSGDANFWTNTAQQITQVVSKASTTTSVLSLNSPSNYNTSVTLQATVAVVAPGSGTPTGTVQFKDNGNNLGPAVTLDASGIAQLIVDGTSIPILTPGTHSITAIYSGDPNYTGNSSLAFSQIVNKGNPVITWPAPAAITYGTALSSTQLKASTAVPGIFVYSPASGAVLNAGVRGLSVTFTPTDTANYNSVSPTVFLTVNQADLTITAGSASRNYGAANPVSAVSVGGIQNGDVITATTSISATSTSPVGTYAIVPIASGVALGNYAVTANNGTLTITQAPTFTGVGIGPNPTIFGSGTVSVSGYSVAGSLAILSAKVSSTTSGTPTGAVTFMDGATLLGTITVDPFGFAKFSTSAFAVGSHSVFAVYAGDTNFTGSTSSPINLTVSASGAVTLSSTGLTFGNQFPGTFSAVQNVTLTNTGAKTLIVDTLITAGDFFNTNNCGSLSAGASCVIRVAFSPSQLGASTGALIITSNAPSRVQSIPLTGTGTDISIAFSRPARPSRSAANVIVAGQSARMELNLATTNSASGKVALTCSGVPAGATCSVFPATADLSGAGTPITVVVNTTARPLQRAARLSSITRDLPSGTSPGNYALHITATTRVWSGSVDLPISVK
jgi:hypothetical protein